jgi:hypothetical protein
MNTKFITVLAVRRLSNPLLCGRRPFGGPGRMPGRPWRPPRRPVRRSKPGFRWSKPRDGPDRPRKSDPNPGVTSPSTTACSRPGQAFLRFISTRCTQALADAATKPVVTEAVTQYRPPRGSHDDRAPTISSTAGARGSNVSYVVRIKPRHQGPEGYADPDDSDLHRKHPTVLSGGRDEDRRQQCGDGDPPDTSVPRRDSARAPRTTGPPAQPLPRRRCSRNPPIRRRHRRSCQIGHRITEALSGGTQGGHVGSRPQHVA